MLHVLRRPGRRTSRQPERTGCSRRAVLAAAAGAAGLVTAGCSAEPDEKERRRKDRDTRIRRRGASAAADLLDRYTATAARHPRAAARLEPLRAEARAQLTAFGGRPERRRRRGAGSPSVRPSSSASSSASGGPSARASADPPPPIVPAGEAAALAELRAAAERASDARIDDLPGASPELARLLASVAGSWSGHAVLLGGGS